jgi:succinate-semialdehyde dehydrogenase / glutarate-semialdehyde dehydrogenase
MALVSINPYSGKIIGQYVESGDPEIDRAISFASDSFNTWKNTPFSQRNTLMLKTAGILRQHVERHSEIITLEMGKPIAEARKEVEKCAWVCEYYAAEAGNFLRQETMASDAYSSYVCYEPLGVILGIMPWNFPFWQVFRFAVPAIMAGNTVVLKHASNVQGCAVDIEEVFKIAGLLQGVFTNLPIGSARIASAIEHPLVKAISLTGGEEAGRHVAGIAGKSIKKTVLELGGNNAFIVLEDANLELAINTGIQARMLNAGQSCISAKRFIVHRSLFERFVSLFGHRLKDLKTGDPMDPETEMGPLSSEQQALKVRDQVERSIAMGAKLITGGIQKNAFFTPTLLTEVKPGMPVFDEEVFGPVVPVTVFQDTGEAIRLANLSKFGLGVSVFTNDLKNVGALVHAFDDGAVFINELVKSDPRLPFGGTKYSGYGRELGIHGIREFVNVKTVYIKKSG